MNDATENATYVSLTMYDGYNTAIAAVPVAIGTAAAGEYGSRGLDVSGDSATVATLLTDDIYGENYGVYLSGVEATITGSVTDPALLKTISVDTVQPSPSGVDGVYITGSRLDMSNYAVTGEVNGVNIVGGSDAELTNVKITGGAFWLTTGTGIIVGGSGDASPSSLDLHTAEVTGDNGIEVNRGSTLGLAAALPLPARTTAFL